MFNQSVSLLRPGLGDHRPLGAPSLLLTKRTREVGGKLVSKPISQTGTLRLSEDCTAHPRSHGEQQWSPDSKESSKVWTLVHSLAKHGG